MELAICFSETDHDDSPEIIEALAALIHMNKEITRLVDEAKQSLVDQQRDTELRQQAVVGRVRQAGLEKLEGS